MIASRSYLNRGLTPQQVSASRQKYGGNTLTEMSRKGFFGIFKHFSIRHSSLLIRRQAIICRARFRDLSAAGLADCTDPVNQDHYVLYGGQ